MVVDASALIAVLRREPEDEAFVNAMADADAVHMSPINWLEVAINTERGGNTDFQALERFATRLGIVIVSVDAGQMQLAHRAWLRFGKGRDRARLNLGDCFAYALAKTLNEPLLFKGNDFSKTDITPAL